MRKRTQKCGKRSLQIFRKRSLNKKKRKWWPKDKA